MSRHGRVPFVEILYSKTKSSYTIVLLLPFLQVLLDELAGTGGADSLGAEDFDPMVCNTVT